MGQRGDQIRLLRDRSVLVAHAKRASSVFSPLASQSEHNGTDLRTDALDLLEDALFGLTIGRDAIDEGGEVIGRVALAEIGFRSVFGDVQQVLSDEIAQGVRDALRFGHRAIFILHLRDVLRGDLSQSFAALDVILQIAHSQNGLLEGDSALCALRSLTHEAFRGDKQRIAFGVALEDRSSKGGDEFEVLGAHFIYLFMLTC